MVVEEHIKNGEIKEGMFVALESLDGMIIYAGYDEVKAEKEANRFLE
ncbi:hypothetical protein KAJ61_00725 [Candidatus Parcubacteria bacterium]|nr:hypothetical protein [Candidatus Parcubacteria bacterium]